MSFVIASSISWLKKATGARPQAEPVPQAANDLLSAEARSILSSLPFCCSVHSSNGHLLWVSPKIQRLLELTEDQASGYGFLSRSNPQDQPAILHAISSTAHSGNPHQCILRKPLLNEDGSQDYRTYELACSSYEIDMPVDGDGLVIITYREINEPAVASEPTSPQVEEALEPVETGLSKCAVIPVPAKLDDTFIFLNQEMTDAEDPTSQINILKAG